MATTIKDRWLWLGLGVFAIASTHLVSHALHQVLDLTTLHPPPDPEDQDSPQPPNTTNTNTSPAPPPHPSRPSNPTLHTLALQQTNPQLSTAATTLLTERFLSSSACLNKLRHDLFSSDPDIFHRGRLTLDMLMDHSDREFLDDILRTRRADEDGEEALDAFWRRVDEEYGQGDYAGLGGLRVREMADRVRQSLSERTPGVGWTQENQDAEEREIRRRRREAVVINEGNRPWSNDDVFMREVVSDNDNAQRQ